MPSKCPANQGPATTAEGTMHKASVEAHCGPVSFTQNWRDCSLSLAHPFDVDGKFAPAPATCDFRCAP